MNQGCILLNEGTMTDIELLELAAKAAGGFVYVDDMGWIAEDETGGRGRWWNPIADDGDALKLAVKLGISIYPNNGLASTAEFELPPDENGIHFEGTTVVHGDDKYEATRRAIVRAAAEIGKSK